MEDIWKVIDLSRGGKATFVVSDVLMLGVCELPMPPRSETHGHSYAALWSAKDMQAILTEEV